MDIVSEKCYNSFAFSKRVGLTFDIPAVVSRRAGRHIGKDALRRVRMVGRVRRTRRIPPMERDMKLPRARVCANSRTYATSVE